MKRKALLAITGCTKQRFDTYLHREMIPFQVNSGSWTEYTIEDAFQLKLLIQATEITDVDTASKLAVGALHQLYPLDPFAFSGDQELFVALIRYTWPDQPEDWDGRTVVAGRWQDIDAKARERIEGIAPGVMIAGILALPVKQIALDVQSKAQDYELPEGEPHSVPEDLTGFPEWFKVAEHARRELLREFTWSEQEGA